MTTFTRGGHGYAEEEGLSSMASPHHAGYDDGAHLHHMDSAQQPDMSGAPGTSLIITTAKPLNKRLYCLVTLCLQL